MAEILKAHGSRNDIFITALTPGDFASDGELRQFVRGLCDRTGSLGGGDGIYFHDADTLRAWFFNPDGSSAEFCGNGMRCLGRHVLDRRQAESATLTSGGTQYTVTRGAVTDGVTMIRLEHPRVSFQRTGVFTELTVPNPHLVTLIDSYNEQDLVVLGEKHPGTNVSVLLPVTESEIFVRTYERGAGLTASCGSGMAAARAVWSRLGRAPQELPVVIHNAGGMATAHLRDWRPVLEGNATYLYRADLPPRVPLPPAVEAEHFTADPAAYTRLERHNEAWLSATGIQIGECAIHPSGRG
jgi:diaminopimelate epimerase